MPAITSYLDLISVAQAKVYLRIDDTLNEDDSDIEQMIKASFLFIERYTNHIFINRSFEQMVPPKIYNTPVTEIDGESQDNFDWDNYYQRNYDKIYGPFGSYIPPIKVSYKAGYLNTEDVPADLIQSAKQLLKVWYYESEKQENSTLIPISVRQVLDSYRTFV